MAEPHAITLAEAKGTTELHVEPSALGITAAGWVALSMLFVIGLMLWKKVPQLIAGMLDTRIATIRTQLDEAAQLRGEAERLLAEAKARSAASAGDAAAIVAHAEAE
uniref:F0F1 ATP synthase subunit B family protein n=1 Tax=Sphingomonas bacterium TaxID=1895847 RepID=UPI003F68B407